MTALIADTSPLLRKIPSDPGIDRHAFGFSPSPMSFARYLAEGRQGQQVEQQQQQQQQRQQSPNPRGYSAHQTAPAPYPRGYGGYAVAEAFPYDDPGVPARIPHKSCRCQRRCACPAGASSSAGSRTQQQASGAPSSMWHSKDSANSNSHSSTSARPGPGLFAEAARAGPSPSLAPQSLSVSARAARSFVANPPPATKKQSDWENLLGAVDLELRAQRAEFVPEQTATAVPRFSSAAAAAAADATCGGRPPLHPSVGDNRYRSASISPELGPYKPTHRRGGGDAGVVSGGGPAYSGSTADAASLLATLPQRMLDRASMAAPKSNAVGVSAPALVSDAALAPQPIRVQASGRRGPRGQSRFKGVCITRAGKWRAVIYIGRKQKYLGVFDSEFDAARAYDASALQHFAEGAKLNFPDGIEQQLNDLSSGNGSDKPFPTAGAGGAAAARSATPPALEGEEVGAGSGASSSGSARKRSRKSAFGEGEDDEWVRDVAPWNNSRR